MTRRQARSLLPIALACLGLWGPLFAQTHYTDYRSDQKTYLFQDNFTDNSNGWWTGRDEADEASISAGYLNWMRVAKDGKTSFWTTPANLNESQDFEIETRFRIVSSEERYLCGLIWGRSTSSTSDYVFGFSQDGDYRIAARKDDTWSYYTDWVKEHINPNGYNKLTVRKVGNWYYYFVNEQFVHQERFTAFHGPRVGFVVHARSKVSIDYLSVAQLAAGGGSGPSANGPTYMDYTSAQKQDAFYDGFDDNRTGWWTGNDGIDESTIAQGYLQWERLQLENATSFWTSFEVDESRNFEIETRIKLIKAIDDNLSGILWGRSASATSDFVFGFNQDGAWRIFNRENDDWTYLSELSSTLIYSHGYNKLTIRKVGREYQFFINEVLAHTAPFRPFYGPRIGFMVNQGAKVYIDYLRVSYLGGSSPNPTPTPPAPNTPPEIVITEPDVRRGFNVVPAQRIRVAGQAIDRDGIREVSVNNIVAALQADGSFAADIPLAVGENTITVRATDRRNMTATRDFTLTRRNDPVPVNERRLALIVGNSSYTYGGSLRNPSNDARDIATSLERLGFKVMRYNDLDQRGLKEAIDVFGREMKGYDVGLFFYAGHGVQVGGNNYLVPVNAQLESEEDVEYDCVRADRVLAKMEAAGARTNIVILDACRDNPFERSWSRNAGGSGLAFMNAPQGSLVAYATSPGNTASDGTGNNGLYTEALLEHINTPNLTIEDIFKRVRASVVQRSGGKQVPWESTSLTGNFYFRQ